MRPGDRTLDITAGYDPRITPRQWLTASAGESPDATLSRFVAMTEERLALGRARAGPEPQVRRLPTVWAGWTGRFACCTVSWIRGSTSAT